MQGVAEGRGGQVTPGRGLHCGRRAALFSLPRCEQAPGKAALPCSIGLRVQLLFSTKKEGSGRPYSSLQLSERLWQGGGQSFLSGNQRKRLQVVPGDAQLRH